MSYPDYEQDQPAQNSGYGQPVEYRHEPSRSPELPIGAKVLAIIGLVFVGIGLLCKLGLNGLGLATGLAGAQDVVMPQSIVVISIVQLGAQVIGSVLLLAGSVGVLRGAAWGRGLTLVYAVFAIVASLAYGVAGLLTIDDQISMQANNPFVQQGAQARSILRMTVIVTLVLTALVSLIYPIVLLVYFNLGRVRAYFKGEGELAPLPDGGGDYYGP